MKFIKASLFSLTVALVSFSQSFGQTSKKEYQARVNIIDKNINSLLRDPKNGLYLEHIGKHENPYSYLWPLCALIQSANEMEVLQKGNYMSPVQNAIEHYYTKEAPAPSYMSYIKKSSRFYDDNQWIAIAYLDAFKRTKNKFYLEKAKEIYTWLLTGYDDVLGGGLYWQEDKKESKNTCSNGPNILISLQLYNITKEKKYLDTGLLVYNWTTKNLRSESGVFWDAVSVKTGKIGYGTYTYNTGTMLQANVLLYQITKEQKYLTEAQTIASAAEKHFYKDQKLPDHYWFNAVLLRGYEELYRVEKNPQRIKFIVDDAERVWKEERDEQNLLGRGKEKSLLMQAGIMEIYARLANLNMTKF